MNWSNFETFFIFFIIYSFLGNVVQSIYVQIANLSNKKKKIENTIFLNLPLVPIYGFGAILIILITNNFLPPQPSFIFVFLICLVVCTLLELVTGELLRIIFKKNYWWDYSDHKFNFRGQISLKNALLFGLGGTLVYYIIQPIILSIGENLNDSARTLIFWGFFILLILDFIYSSIKNWKKSRQPQINFDLHNLEKQYHDLEKKLNQLKEEYQATLENLSEKAFPTKK